MMETLLSKDGVQTVAKEKSRGNQWQLGTLFGIPLLIDSSWLLIVGLVTFINATAWQEEFPVWGVSTAWVTGFLMALLLFGSVLLHELGHSLVAQSQGIKVNSITLFLFGGIASLDQEAKTPEATFWVAIAGPIVSLLLWLGLSLIACVTPEMTAGQVLCQNLAEINLVLVLFNLIPGLPLDGGQVLKALIWKITNNRFKGSHWAAKVGQALGWGAVILGLFVVLLTGSFTGIWMSLLGWFGLRNAYRYDRFTDLQEIVLKLTAHDVMSRKFRVVKGDQTLRDFADQYLLNATDPQLYYAAANGRYLGLVEPDKINGIERSLWEQQTVETIVTSMTDMPTVMESTPLVNVVDALETKHLPQITVLSPAGAIAGVIERSQIVKTVMTEMDVTVPEAELDQIKQTQAYPAFMPLPSIVTSIKSDLGEPQAEKAPELEASET